MIFQNISTLKIENKIVNLVSNHAFNTIWFSNVVILICETALFLAWKQDDSNMVHASYKTLR